MKSTKDSRSSINERQKNRYDMAERLVRGEPSARSLGGSAYREASTGHYVTTSKDGKGHSNPVHDKK